MGKKDDWCSSKGWKARGEGIKKVESRQKKCCITICFAICAIICFVIGGIQLSHATNAALINDEYEHPLTTNAYDSCSYPTYILDSSISATKQANNAKDILDYCDGKASSSSSSSRYSSSQSSISKLDCFEVGTNWTLVWNYNGSIMVIMAVNFLLLSLGGFFFYPRCLGTVMNCCFACCCHSSAISIAFTARYNPFGEACSWNTSPVLYEGDYKWDEDGYTYKDEAVLIATFAAVQSALCLAQCFCCWLPLYSTPTAEGKKKAKKEESHSQANYYGQQQQQPVGQADHQVAPYGQPAYGQPAYGQPAYGQPVIANQQQPMSYPQQQPMAYSQQQQPMGYPQQPMQGYPQQQQMQPMQAYKQQ